MRRLGNSVDWERERFTMDEGLSNAVKEVFVRLYKEDLIYRGKRRLTGTETAHRHFRPRSGKPRIERFHVAHPLPLADGAKPLTVKITGGRHHPSETLLGDTGVAVNPEDPRYKDLIGKFVVLPLVNRRIPIVGDEHADMEKAPAA